MVTVPAVEEVREALGIGGRVYEAVLDRLPGGRKSRPSAGIVLYGRGFGRVKTKSPRKWGLFCLVVRADERQPGNDELDWVHGCVIVC